MNEKPKLSLIKQLIARVRYPGISDGQSIYDNAVVPFIYLEILSGLVKEVGDLASLVNLIPGSSAKTIDELALNIVNLLGSGVVVGCLPLFYGKFKERANRVSFGDNLTVSKTAVVGWDNLVRQLPKLQGEKYYGELHFVGKKLDAFVTHSQNPRQMLREGIAGLHELMVACEEEDPRLEGLNQFVGVSKIITPGLSRFGFEVQNYRSYRSRWHNLLTPQDLLHKFNAHNMNWLDHRQLKIITASREDLISHRKTTERFLP